MIKKKTYLFSKPDEISKQNQIEYSSIKYAKKITFYPMNIQHTEIYPAHIIKTIILSIDT